VVVKSFLPDAARSANLSIQFVGTHGLDQLDHLAQVTAFQQPKQPVHMIRHDDKRE
jgi:hypothetical protein